MTTSIETIARAAVLATYVALAVVCAAAAVSGPKLDLAMTVSALCALYAFVRTARDLVARGPLHLTGATA